MGIMHEGGIRLYSVRPCLLSQGDYSVVPVTCLCCGWKLVFLRCLSCLNELRVDFGQYLTKVHFIFHSFINLMQCR